MLKVLLQICLSMPLLPMKPRNPFFFSLMYSKAISRNIWCVFGHPTKMANIGKDNHYYSHNLELGKTELEGVLERGTPVFRLISPDLFIEVWLEPIEEGPRLPWPFSNFIEILSSSSFLFFGMILSYLKKSEDLYLLPWQGCFFLLASKTFWIF